MGRPAKPVSTSKSHRSKAEKATRKEVQDKVKGEADKLAPASYLTPTQKKIFKDIVNHLEASELLGNCDIFILEQTCVAIDSLRKITIAINENENAMLDKNLMCTKEKFSKDLVNGINHLGLSPTSRAKIGTMAVAKKEAEKDPLLKALGE